MSMYRNVVILILVCVFPLSYVFSQQQSSSEIAPLVTFDAWNVTLLGVQTENYNQFTQEQKNIIYRINPLISSVVRETKEHYLSVEEKYQARELKREDALYSLNTTLQNLLENTDVTALANEDRTIYESRLSIRKQKKEVEKKIKTLQALDNKDIPMENKLPVVFKDQLTITRISLAEDFQAIAVQLRAHVLLYYRIYLIEDYTLIDIYTYNAVLRDTRRVMRTVVDTDNISQLFDSLRFGLHSVILGTDSASLEIKVFSSGNIIDYDAKILIDGQVLGFGTAFLLSLEAGTHVITILYRDTQKNEVIVLEKNQKALRNYFFGVVAEDTITVLSEPTNASVYINSEWVGNTPAVIPIQKIVSQLEIRSDDYKTARMTIDQNTKDIIEVTLEPTHTIPLRERIKIDRKKFYTAFTIFAVSLAAPIILNGFYINELNAYQTSGSQLSPAGYSAYVVKRDVLFYSYIGSALVSTGLGIYAFVKLQKYLKTASEYHER